MTANDTEVVEGQGAEAEPTPPVSQPETSPSDRDVETLADALFPLFEQRMEKQFQGYKDKRFDKITNQVTEVQSVLDKYDQLLQGGKSPEEAKAQMQLDERLQKLEQMVERSSPETQAGTPQPVTSVETQAILKGLGLNENTPEVAAILRGQAEFTDQVAAFTQLAVSQQSQQTNPNPATVQPTGAGESTQTENIDTLTVKLEKLQEDPNRNFAEIQETSEKLKALLR